MRETHAPALAVEGSSPRDEELVILVRAGERHLYDLLMRRHNRKVYRVLRALLKDDQEAEDVAQEAWVRAYCALDQFAGHASFATWVMRIALNEGLARLKAASRFTERDLAALSDHGESPEVEAERAELRRLLTTAIDALPDALRTVFVLREVEGRSTAAVAEILGVTKVNVKVRLHRARTRLRRAIEHRLAGQISELFGFGGERCNQLRAAVLARISSVP